MRRELGDAGRNPTDTLSSSLHASAAPGSMTTDKSSAADSPSEQVHTVVAGDTLPRLAKHYYGDPTLYPKIYEANLDTLADPNKLRPGQKLRIP
jgi:nucleoid-associated protein YgaU